MNYFAFFCFLTENLFLVAGQKARSAPHFPKDELSFSSKLRILRETDGWKKRMAVREFLGDYEKRRKELDRVLTQGRQIERNFFIDPSFLKEVASLVEEDVSRATVLLASNILAARG